MYEYTVRGYSDFDTNFLKSVLHRTILDWKKIYRNILEKRLPNIISHSLSKSFFS
jgi:hypothetical protein